MVRHGDAALLLALVTPSFPVEAFTYSVCCALAESTPT